MGTYIIVGSLVVLSSSLTVEAPHLLQNFLVTSISSPQLEHIAVALFAAEPHSPQNLSFADIFALQLAHDNSFIVDEVLSVLHAVRVNININTNSDDIIFLKTYHPIFLINIIIQYI